MATQLSNVNYVAFGDSIIAAGVIPNVIGTRTGLKVTNCAQSGTGFVRGGALSGAKTVESILNKNWQGAFAATAGNALTRKTVDKTRLFNFYSASIITISLGTNDFGDSIDIGTNSDVNFTTFKGALNYFLENMLFIYPNCRYLLTTPFWRNTNFVGAGGTILGDSDTTPNGDGVYLKGYADAIIEIGALKHVPVLDLYRESGINKWNERAYLLDGTHPTTAGARLVGNMIASKLLSIY